MSRLALIPALAAALIAGPALAQTAAAPAAAPAATQPAAGKKLTEILSGIEGEAGFVRFDDIEWDNRDGTWEIEYLGTGGRQVKIEINGVTGQPVVK